MVIVYGNPVNAVGHISGIGGKSTKGVHHAVDGSNRYKIFAETGNRRRDTNDFRNRLFWPGVILGC